MKLNLLINNPDELRSGYLNIDQFAPDCSNDGRVKGDVLNLDAHADDNEVVEIVAHDILDKVDLAQADAVLNNWLKKLAHKGKLTISVVDTKEVARALVLGTMSIDDANLLLHGEPDSKTPRLASYTLGQLAQVISNKGYKVLTKRIFNFRAVITVERP